MRLELKFPLGALFCSSKYKFKLLCHTSCTARAINLAALYSSLRMEKLFFSSFQLIYPCSTDESTTQWWF